jgi:hypothetical protein
LNEKNLNPKLVERDLNPNPQKGVAQCSSNLTYTQKPIKKLAYTFQFKIKLKL